MSEKNLSEAEWKKFAKGRELKDAALVKALAALDKAKTPEQALAALEDLEKQSDTLRKSAKGDKELGKYLDDLDKSLDKERKSQDAEAKKLAKEAAAKDSGADEEEESPVLLTAKMVPLIRQVKKGEEMQVLLANTGKEVAVMLSRRAISPSKRKLLSDYLDAGTPKYFAGTCVFEENAYTFVLKTQAAGLAKKIKAALLKQVELRLKVRVRGEDPGDVDDDGEEAPQDEQEGEEASSTASPQAPTAPTQQASQADPLEAEFKQRWARLEPRIVAALKAQQGDVSKLRAVAEFVGQKDQAGQYKAALQGADSLEKLLEAVPAPAAAQDKPGVDPGAAFNARLAALLPKVKDALAEGAPADLKLKVSEAGTYARKADFRQANLLLDAAEKLMATAGAPLKQEGGSTESSANRFKTLLSSLLKKAQGMGSPRDSMDMLREAGALAKAGRFAQAIEQLERAEGALVRNRPVLDQAAELASALDEWKATREQVVVQLERLGTAIEGMRHPQGDRAIILVRSIARQLPRVPDTIQAVREVERYLTTDDVIAEAESKNGFGIDVDIEAPLMSALAKIKMCLSMR